MELECDIYHQDEIVNENQDNENSETSTEFVPRRSQRAKQAPDFYGVRVNVTSCEVKEPNTLKEALASPDNQKWITAMEKEINSLKDKTLGRALDPRATSTWLSKLTE